jgi:hypothetical protein
MNPYQSPRKAETGLGSDRLPQELRELTPVEIIRSVKETGRCYLTRPIVVHFKNMPTIFDFQN